MLCAIEIRKPREAEVAFLRNLFYEVRKEEFEWVDSCSLLPDDYDSATAGEAILVAAIGGKAAGFISVWEPDRFIHNLFVSKKFRMRGVGAALLKEAARTFGMPMTLKCVKSNLNAVHFYLANGWKIKAEETGAEGPYFLMRFEK